MAIVRIWPDMTIADYPFVPSDVALYHRLRPTGNDNTLDTQTWDDMLLPAYSAELARETSIFGQQELHRRLHANDDGGPASTGRVRALLADDALRGELQTACTDLRRTDREISEMLYGDALPSAPRWLPALAWLPVLFLASAIAALASGWLPLWGVVLAAWLALMGIQARYHQAVQEWSRMLNTIQQMLRAHTLMARIEHPLTAALCADGDDAAGLNRRLRRSLVSALPMVSDYADWLWLQNVRHYFRSRDVVRAQILFLRNSFERVAALDADLALARHLSRCSGYCWAEQGTQVALERVIHPLLDDAAPLSFGMARQGLFISGQNGAGKSTLLRTVGLNLITARAFGFCYATHAVTPRLPVCSSMQNEDAMSNGESFYQAELRRARELLAIAGQRPAIFLVDEIFRGTNYLESVSAAAAVLHALAQQGRVVVASHHLILASLLSDCLQPWCLSRSEDTWRLQAGLLEQTNGLALLNACGFDPAITAKAAQTYAWLSNYMAYPGASVDAGRAVAGDGL
ncbi:MutS-related protein [Duganella callida]|uniref:DNA mismatch repair protein MutS n=1 Tax=Duganella callida TaxID=2561932 RepID=A0A4Y9SNL7_9BURK|nr:DNA mismatch repair protein MutS [Duganella callida]TFW28061.1 DNA mismatch repair protein MutS [Duganella callida]